MDELDNKTRFANKSIMKSMNVIGSSQGRISQEVSSHPSPLNFEAFLPWACQQFPSIIHVNVRNERQREYVSTLDRNKSKTHRKTNQAVNIDIDMLSAISNLLPMQDTTDPTKIEIQAIYNADNQLVHIKFLKNKFVPRRVLQILQVIVKFHRQLEAITMDSGIDEYTIYEISKLLLLSNITELCFDNTFIKEANYYILLDEPNHLKHLSLCRCNLNDACVAEIAKRLEYPQPASKVLSILNLLGNKITDKGVMALGSCLRSNRHLSYLNLAGNMVTDAGADAILDVLLEFPLTSDEIITSKSRFITYLKNKNELIAKLVADYKTFATAVDVKAKKTQSERRRTITASIVGRKKAASLSDEESCYEKAKEVAKDTCGEFRDSYVIDVVGKNGILYSNGNNTLAYINLAYNSLSAITLKKIIKVLRHQNSNIRRPKGLVNINVEGNPFDLQCKELSTIDMLIESGLSLDRLTSFTKRPRSLKSAK